MMGMSIPTLIVPIVIILLALAFVLGLLWVLVWWQDEKGWYLCGGDGRGGRGPCGYWVRLPRTRGDGPVFGMYPGSGKMERDPVAT